MVYDNTWDFYNGLLYYPHDWVVSPIYTLNNLSLYIAQLVTQLAPFGANHPHLIAHFLVIQ